MMRDLATMTWMEIRDQDKTAGAVVLPLGSLEQHGPHLSIDTDLFFSDRFLTLALARLPDRVPMWRLPILPISKSNEHRDFPGTFWLSAQTLMALVSDVAACVKANGFRRLVLWNCHGGNRALLEVIARDVRAATGLMVFSLFPPVVAVDPIPITDEEQLYGIHAGDWETSVMMALSPERVRPDRVEAVFPDFPGKSLDLELTGSTVAWLTPDVTATGTLGDATIATPARGQARAEAVAEALVTILTEIATFEMPTGNGAAA